MSDNNPAETEVMSTEERYRRADQIDAGRMALRTALSNAIREAEYNEAGKECLFAARKLNERFNDYEQVFIHLESAGHDYGDIDLAIEVLFAEDLGKRSVDAL